MWIAGAVRIVLRKQQKVDSNQWQLSAISSDAARVLRVFEN